MESFSSLLTRIGWASWGFQYRIAATAAFVLAALWISTLVVPAALRLLRPLVFLISVALAVVALFPEIGCAVGLSDALGALCRR